MRNFALPVLGALCVACGGQVSDPGIQLSSSTAAITNGTFDGNLHPYVGTIAYKSDGVWSRGCSGSMISPKVFLTAGHCAQLFQDSAQFEEVGVSLEPTWNPGAPKVLKAKSVIANPLYGGIRSEEADQGVILLDDGVEYAGRFARLPAANVIDEMFRDGSLIGQRFTNVGTGMFYVAQGGHVRIPSNGERRYSTSVFRALTHGGDWIMFNESAALGYGGICFNDSGGPNLFEGTDVMASITVITVDPDCKNNAVGSRVDTKVARAFILPFIQ